MFFRSCCCCFFFFFFFFLINLLLYTSLVTSLKSRFDEPDLDLSVDCSFSNQLRILLFFSDEITLEELDAKHLELFDWMCRKLDRRRLGFFYPDYARLARCFGAITPEQREYVRYHGRTIHHRSPSRILMETLQVMYPNLTVGDLVQALKKIRCYDIAARLTDLIEQYKGSYCSTRKVECV